MRMDERRVTPLTQSVFCFGQVIDAYGQTPNERATGPELAKFNLKTSKVCFVGSPCDIAYDQVVVLVVLMLYLYDSHW